MSHISVRPLTDDDFSLIDSLLNLAISGTNQGIAKISATEFENRTFSGGGGGGTWGSITGTLSNQTDLQAALDAKANINAPTFTTSITGSYLTASEILITDASKNIVSAAVATYPSLTELSYVKGVTSAIQTQINTKANSAGALTQFIGNGNWKVWYSDGSGDVVELSLGAAGTYLGSNGAANAPTFSTPAGSGDVVKVGTPVDNQVGVWTGDGTIEGDAALTFDTSTNTLVVGSGIFTVDTITLTGTGTLNGLDAIDATTEATIEAAIDTLANLTSIQSLTVTLADAGADAILGWDDSASAYQNLSAADVIAAIAAVPAARTITINGTANQITSSAGAQDLSANRTWTLSLPADVLVPTVLTVPNTGLHLLDTNASHDLIVAPGSNITADRTLTITTGDTDMIVNVTAVTDGFVLTYDTGTGSWRGEAATSGVPTTITVANEATDTSSFIAFFTAATGDLGPKTNVNMTFDSSTGIATFASTVLTTTDINGGTVDGVTIGGASAGAITGTTITANTGFMPDADDGAYLGQAGTAFADLFLAEGGVINWDSGDATLTQAGNVVTLAGADLAISNLTASEIVITDGSKNLVSAAVATYPSLTELTYVKGVTSAIQTQLNARALAATTITINGTANQITSSAGAQDLSANRTWTLSLPADVIIPTVLTVPNTGLHLLDTNATHDLIVAPGSNLTADRTLTITTGDTDMIVNFTAVTDEYILAYDVGTNTWRGVVAGSGTPGGADTQVQFNDAGSFGGDAGFTYDKTTDFLTVLGEIRAQTIQIEDSNASHYLTFVLSSNLTANRNLAIATGDSDRTITLSGSPTLDDWFNQSVKTTANPQFTTIELGDAADTTLARVSAGVVSIEGVNILTTATGQPLDATLTALAAYNTNGLLTQTAADTFTGRTITGTAAQISVANGDGVAGNPTLSLPADVLIPTVLTVPNTGLHLLDTNASHDLIIAPGSNLTADRTLTITTGDTDMIVNFTAVTDEYILAYDVGTNTWRGVVNTGGVPTTITVANEATDTSSFIAFFTAATGDLGPKTNANMTFDSNTGIATFASTVLTTTDINGGTLDGVVIGGASAAAATVTTLVVNTSANPDANDGATLGAAGTAWSDLFLAEGGVINWDSSDVTITQTGNVLSFAGASTRYEFDFTIAPTSNDGAALGTTALQFSDLFLAEGGVINFDNGDATITQTSNDITIAGISTFGVGTSTAVTLGTIELGAASDTTIARVGAGQISVEGVNVVTISSTDTLTNKTIQAGIIDYVIEPASDDTYEGEVSNDLLAGDTIAQWDLVYLDSTSGRWEFADADAAATAGSVLLAMATAAGTDGNAMNVIFRGIVRNDGWTWTTVGAPLYVSGTPGAITQTQPSGTDDVIRIVGYVISDDCIYFNPENDWITHT